MFVAPLVCPALVCALEWASPLAVAAASSLGPTLHVSLGQSLVYDVGGPVARVLVSNRDIAQVQLLQEGQIQVLGQALGSTDLWVWFRKDAIYPEHHIITVQRDLTDLNERLYELFGGNVPVRASTLNNRLVLVGDVKDADTLASVAQLARVFDPEFVNLMRLVGDHQVQLRVVFAEVNRSRLREMGLDSLWSDGGLLGRAALTASTAPGAVADAFQLVGTLSSPTDLSATLAVLEENKLGRTLARPTLVAMSGQRADFLVGGQIPIPVGQANNQISLEFKDYGVKVSFVPTVLRDQVIDVDASVEVSDMDPANGVTMQGLAIPALSTRKSSSHLRIESGMTFAMAGMLSESVTSDTLKVPILGDIPLLGALFRRVSHERNERELMIFVTPELVRPLAPGEVPAPPGGSAVDDPGDFDLFMMGKDHHGAQPAPVHGVGLER